MILVMLLCSGCPGNEEGKDNPDKDKKILIYCDEAVMPMVHDLVRDYNLNNRSNLSYSVVSKDMALNKAAIEIKKAEEAKKDKKSKKDEESEETVKYIYIGFNLKDNENLKEEYIAYDGISIVVNRNNPIDSLSVKQLRDIYTGKIQYWNQLDSKLIGVNNERIIPIAYNVHTLSIQEKFEAYVMNTPVRGQYGRNVSFVTNVADGRSRILSDNCIGYLGGQNVGYDLKELRLNGIRLTLESLDSELYPLRFPINMYYVSDNEDSLKDVLKYIKSDDGKKIIRKHCLENF
jgi:ABC-type phosphate transport system substrate-binding protein